MFVSKKKYEFILKRYEQAASRADRAESQLAELYDMALKYGGLYKCILECREMATAVVQPGREGTEITISRLAFIDRRLTDLVPVIERRITDEERPMWKDMLEIHSAETAYGQQYPLSKEEPV